MGTTDWLDSLIDSLINNWVGVLLGVGVGVGAPVLLAVLMILVRFPVDTPLTLILTELSIGAAGFVAAWWSREDALASTIVHGVSTALICAFLSLVAAVLANPMGTSPLGVLFLFVSYALMGGLGGVVVWFIEGQRGRGEIERW